MNSQTILITGAISVPGNGAATIHVFRLARLLAVTGFKPMVLVPQATGRKEDLQSDGKYSYRGISYVPIGEATSSANSMGRIGAFLGTGNPLLRYLRHESDPPLAIVCLSLPFGCMARLAAFCRRHKVVLVPEIMEWFDRAHVHSLVHWMDLEARMRCLYPSIGRMFVISSFLERYYAGKGCNVLRVPPVLDTSDAAWKPRQRGRVHSPLRLLFSGSISRDRQDLILSAVRQVRREQEGVTIHYVGSTRDELSAALGKHAALLGDLGDAVVCHGRAPREQVPELMGSADYAVILREKARWSDACFPSKVPEMFALGVPLVCNRTSDLEEYATDGIEAFWISEVSERSVVTALRRAIAGGPDARERMSRAARRRAEQFFDVTAVADKVAEFIHGAARTVRKAV